MDREPHGTWVIGTSEVQVLSKARCFPHVNKILSPNQAPGWIAHGSITAQVGVGVCQTRAAVATVGCALVEASVLDVQELVWDLHPRQGHKRVLSTFQLFISLASSGRVKVVNWLEPIEALARRDRPCVVTVAKWATRGVESTSSSTRSHRNDCPR